MSGLHRSIIDLLVAGLAGLRPSKMRFVVGPVGCYKERQGNNKIPARKLPPVSLSEKRSGVEGSSHVPGSTSGRISDHATQDVRCNALLLWVHTESPGPTSGSSGYVARWLRQSLRPPDGPHAKDPIALRTRVDDGPVFALLALRACWGVYGTRRHDLEAREIGQWGTVIFPANDGGNSIPCLQACAVINPVLGLGNNPIAVARSVGRGPHQSFFVRKQFRSSEGTT